MRRVPRSKPDWGLKQPLPTRVDLSRESHPTPPYQSIAQPVPRIELDVTLGLLENGLNVAAVENGRSSDTVQANAQGTQRQTS